MGCFGVVVLTTSLFDFDVVVLLRGDNANRELDGYVPSDDVSYWPIGRSTNSALQSALLVQ